MADPSTAPPLLPSSIRNAYTRISPYIHHTPLLTSQTLNRMASSASPTHPDRPSPKLKLFFKCENLQKIGAFKARGAYHAVIRCMEEMGEAEVRKRGVVTHSSGNHAQALALAASTFSIPSYIVMPTISTPSKIAGTRLYTPNVIFSGSTSDEREAVVEEVIKETGAILIPPYDHPDIILGQGTLGLELESDFADLQTSQGDEELSGAKKKKKKKKEKDRNMNPARPEQRLDAVMVPLGGGGLLGGISTYFGPDSLDSSSSAAAAAATDAKQKPFVFGCEPSHSGANDAQRGLASSPPKRIPHVSTLTIADGLRTPVGLLNWDLISSPAPRKLVEAVYSVSEDEIKSAMRLVMERVKIVVEPSAVVGLAVVLYCAEWRRWCVDMQEAERKDGRVGEYEAWHVGIVLSGGNTTMEAVAKLFEGQDGKVEEERAAGVVGLDGLKQAEDVAG